MKIIRDTREKLGWQFKSYPDVIVIDKKLDQGDYSIENYEDKIAIERKSVNDFLSSISHSRKRFEAEILRLEPYQFKFIIVEKSLHDTISETILNRRIYPESLLATIVSWNMKHNNIHFYFMDNEEWAEQMAYRIFNNYLKNYSI